MNAIPKSYQIHPDDIWYLLDGLSLLRDEKLLQAWICRFGYDLSPEQFFSRDFTTDEIQGIGDIISSIMFEIYKKVGLESDFCWISDTTFGSHHRVSWHPRKLTIHEYHCSPVYCDKFQKINFLKISGLIGDEKDKVDSYCENISPDVDRPETDNHAH